MMRMQMTTPSPVLARLGPLPGAEAPEVELSIIMPCLNEAETLEGCIRKAQGFLENAGIKGEIIVGDNGSTDGSQAIARRCGARVVTIHTRGYGAAIAGASLAAYGKYIIMGDSDESYDFGALMPFVEKLRLGYDLVMGNRFMGGIKDGAMPWKNRYIGNPVLTAIGRLLFQCPVRDFHCGLRGYSTDAYKRMGLQTTGMEFASEMVIKATTLGLKIAEVPCTLSPDGRSRPPHLRPWRDGWRHLRFMLLYSPLWLFLVPGLLLFALGLFFSAWLATANRQVGPIGFHIDALLIAGFILLVGYQVSVFGVFTKIFAIMSGLHPPMTILNSLFRFIKLEVGLLLGFVLVIVGGIGLAVGVWGYSDTRFGKPDQLVGLRLLIISVVIFTLGVQTVFASFFLSILGLQRRPA
jgi:glycosyltransferase involved in cell wall biosynthesis